MSPRRRPIIALAATATIAAAALLTSAGAASAQGLAFRTCRDNPGTGCATLQVPLDHADPSKGTIDLAVQRRRGKGSTKGVFVMLSGGPGQAGLPIPQLDRIAASMPAGWDYISLDMRGTGNNALKCAALDTPDPKVDDSASMATCAQQVGPRRVYYGSRDMAEDIEDLRVALGMPTLAVGGISYGTYVAQYYATLFPQSLDHLVLDSVVNPADMNGLDLSTFQATTPVLTGLCANGNCAGITTDPVGDLAALVESSNQAPLRGRGANAKGQPITGSIGGPRALGDLPALLAAGDMNATLRGMWPGAIKAATAGDAGPLIRVAVLSSQGGNEPPSEFSTALWSAARCNDDIPLWTTDDTADQRTAKMDAAFTAAGPDVFAPFAQANARPDSTARACVSWPEAGVDPQPVVPLPNVPTLVLSGGQDTRTPTSGALDVASRSPQATTVIAPGAGHDLLDQLDCADVQLMRLLAGRSLNARACAAVTPKLLSAAVPAPAASVSVLSPLGAPGTAGRVAHAARFSIKDAMSTIDAAIGAGLTRIQGIRGGTMTPSSSDTLARFTFRRYSDTPQVAVSGTLTQTGSRITGRVAVDGPGAHDGWLQLNNAGGRVWYSGQVGGSSVYIKVR